MYNPKIQKTEDNRYIAWVQSLAESDVCDTKEEALMDLCKILCKILYDRPGQC